MKLDRHLGKYKPSNNQSYWSCRKLADGSYERGWNGDYKPCEAYMLESDIENVTDPTNGWTKIENKLINWLKS